MSVATGTGSTAELATLWEALVKAEKTVQAYAYGTATGGASGKQGRFTYAEVDAALTAVTAAITAVNA